MSLNMHEILSPSVWVPWKHCNSVITIILSLQWTWNELSWLGEPHKKFLWQTWDFVPTRHLSSIVSPNAAILGSQKGDLYHIWRIGQLASSSLRGGVGVLISGLQPAKFTLWASFNLPSSQAKVTSVKSLSKLEKYYFTVTSLLMHALILVIWGDTTTANWREPYQCYQCDYNFFCKPTVKITY